MIFFKSEIVFVRVLLPFFSGIACGYFWPEIFDLVEVASLTGSLLLILLSVNLCYKKFNIYRFKPYISVIYYFAFFLSGICLVVSKIDFLDKDYFAVHKMKALKVVVDNEPEKTGQIIKFQAVVVNGLKSKGWQKTIGKLLVAIKTDSASNIAIKYGDELIIPAKYSEIEPPYNPAEFNFKRYLANERIYHQTFLQQNEFVKVASNLGNPIISFAYNLRQRQIAVYRKLIKNDEAFAVASTLILGYRADLSQETLAAYSVTGTIHALSVSGAHVGIIYLVLTAIFSFCNRHPSLKLLRFLCIVFLIWYYALITGFSPSVLRAVVMLTILMVSKYRNRYSNPYNTLAFTALVILIYDPLLIWNVGFQLSFLAVLGLIYITPKIDNWLHFENRIIRKIWATIAMSLGAQLATFPLSIYYFHQFPVYFLVANLFILLPLVLLMYFGLGILLLFSFISAQAAIFLAPVFEWLIVLMNNVLKSIASWPFAGITAIWINHWQLLLLSTGLIAFLYGLINHQKNLIFISLTLFSGYQIFACVIAGQQRAQQKAIFYSLKKNYAYAFVKGDQCALITDLKPNDKAFKFFVKPSLDQMQIQKIDFVDWRQDYHNQYVYKANHQIKFANAHFLLVDKSFEKKRVTASADMLLIHENPYINRHLLIDDLKFKRLLVDATVKDYRAKTYLALADSSGIASATLKNRPAFQIKYR